MIVPMQEKPDSFFVKVVLCIVIYNRFQNLQHWLHCWKQCEQRATMVVIHTGDEIDMFREACKDVIYIHRPNEGFDIGCLQDVFRERLPGFPEWDLLLWATDDTWPMRKDFIQPYLDAMQPGVGIAAMQISRSVADHVRTTGFMIRRETAVRIRFPADPVTTKGHCYHFEHRGGKDTLTSQVRVMGLSCVQIAPIRKSPMWDSAHPNARLRLDRRAEHDAVFSPGVTRDKVTFICTIYNTYPQIISSLLLQTHKNWELILIHDGPSSNGMRGYIPDDPRIKYIETPVRQGKFGHPLRRWALQEIKQGRLSQPDFICIGNSDNYIVPVFTEYMLKGFKQPSVIATYTASMVHSYKAWDVIPCRFAKGFIDCAGVMVRADVATEIGWRDTESHSADWEFFSDIAARYNSKNFQPVKGCLLIHNVIIISLFITIIYVIR